MKESQFLLIILLSIGQSLIGQDKIFVDPQNVYQLAMEGDPQGLFDEQELVGDPERGKAVAPISPFDHTARVNNANARYIVDLGAIYSLSAMWIYDINAKDTLFIYSGPFDSLISDGFIITDQYNSWQRLPLDGKGQFVMLDFNTMGAKVGEVVFYGEKIRDVVHETPTSTIAKERKTIGQILGVNTFNWCPKDLMEPFSTVREFREWSWNDNEDSMGQALAFSPAYKFNSDEFYREMSSLGVDVVPCIQLSPQWLTGKKEGNVKPIEGDASSYLPSSYKQHSAFLYQYAVRYGSNTDPLVKPKLKLGQKKLSGTGWLRWLENWNEPDKRWKGRESFFNPFEYAAMCSADYDGHNGRLGKGHGVKKADPNFKMAMGGLTQLDLNYLRTMKLWSDHMRNGFPADAINLHHYSNDAGGQHMNAEHGVSPEQDQLREKLESIVNWRNNNLPEQEIWLSEFGYATNESSSQKAWYEGSDLKTDEVQAQWLVRGILELAAAGIDRAFIFNVYDPRSENTTAFGSCGLAMDPWGPDDCGTADGSCPHQHEPYKKKKSWYAMKGLLQLMSNFSYSDELESDNSQWKAYKFSNDDGDKIYCLWTPDEKDIEVDIRQLIGNEIVKSIINLSKDEKLFNNLDSGYSQGNDLSIDGNVIFITTN